MVMMNRYPYTNGHLMVAPYAHVPGLTDVETEVQHDLITCMAACNQILGKVYQPQGLNLGANFGECAGAGVVDHLHFHLVPRWGGDTNFMTTVGEIRVIPEHLERTYDELAPHFEELADR
jgi:ATP adenylyltransferase